MNAESSQNENSNMLGYLGCKVTLPITITVELCESQNVLLG